MAVADKDVSLIVSGNGDVLEPEDGLIGIGSGGNYALSAARAIIDREDLDCEAIAKKSMEICDFDKEFYFSIFGTRQNQYRQRP